MEPSRFPARARFHNYLVALPVALIGFSLTVSSIHSKAVAQRGEPTPGTESTKERTWQFEVVSIKPVKDNSPRRRRLELGLHDMYIADGMPPLATIDLAYLPRNQWITKWPLERILNLPSWAKTTRYDIEAKVAPEDLAAFQNQGLEKRVLQSMLQSMLADRFKLVVHHTTVEASAYALVVARPGTGLRRAAPDETVPASGVQLADGGTMIPYEPGQVAEVKFFATPMSSFATILSNWANRPVVDQTGLVGPFDFGFSRRDDADESPSDPEPAIDWDLGALGLKLIPKKVPVDAIVIDHIEQPTEN